MIAILKRVDDVREKLSIVASVFIYSIVLTLSYHEQLISLTSNCVDTPNVVAKLKHHKTVEQT